MAETQKLEMEHYVIGVLFLIVAGIAACAWMFSKLLLVLTLFIGKPLRVYVVRKEIELVPATLETSEYFIHHVTVEHGEWVNEVSVSPSVYETIIEGKTYVVKGKRWADGELTLVGQWQPLIPMSTEARQNSKRSIEACIVEETPVDTDFFLASLCCVMVSDGKISKKERAVIMNVVAQLPKPLSQTQIDDYVSHFISRIGAVGFKGVLANTILRLESCDSPQKVKLAFSKALGKRPNNC